MRVLRHRQGAVRSISDAAVNRGSGGYCRTREITTFGLAWNGCARKTGGLIHVWFLARSTRRVQVRASCRIYALRVALGTLLASCVRSDARRRQSRSFLSNGFDFDIAHRLDRRCTALHGIARPVGGLRHTRKQNDAKILQRAASRNIRTTRRGSSENSQRWPRMRIEKAQLAAAKSLQPQILRKNAEIPPTFHGAFLNWECASSNPLVSWASTRKVPWPD
jgi:hypothetical protein